MKNTAEFLHSLIEVSHIEFQSYDFHLHKIIFSSGIAEKVLGYTKDEYYEFSRNFYVDLIHPDDLQMMQESIDKIIHSAQGEIIEMTARFPENRWQLCMVVHT